MPATFSDSLISNIKLEDNEEAKKGAEELSLDIFDSSLLNIYKNWPVLINFDNDLKIKVLRLFKGEYYGER